MPSDATIRAAQYLRMSREHQNYSLEHQALANTAWATEHGVEIVRTYSDAGLSGVRLERRDALKALLADVLGGRADYTLVLVYDVSRWGRFQDPDESAHYEYICRAAGVRLEYTAEPFANDGTLLATLAKNLKRSMAAEYSRDLSDKVARAQKNLAARGFWQGGPCGYGFRRMAVTADGAPRRAMTMGEQKAYRGDRTVLVTGPPEEVETVRRIFRLFAIAGLKPWAIARQLNGEGVAAEEGARWTSARVRALLRNERYIGVLVTGRRRYRFGRRFNQAPATWTRVPGACPALVDEALFRLVQGNLQRCKPKVADAELIAELREVLARHGRLSHDIVRDDPATHCPDVYKRRFGDLITAYRLAGFTPSERQVSAAAHARRSQPHLRRHPQAAVSDEALIAGLHRVLAREGRLTVELLAEAADAPHPEIVRRRFGGMRRAYALAGYTPSPHQDRLLSARGGQSLSAEAARALCALHPAPPSSI